MRVLVVDDSAVVRQMMTAILSHAGIEVMIAADPLIAMDKIERSRPDVIVLDVEMPRMDGITFLRLQMAQDPIPVVVCSSLAGKGTEVAMRALSEGAVAIVEKPKLGVKEFLEESARNLVETVQQAAQAKPRRVSEAPAVELAEKGSALPFAQTTDKVIVIGASIGGTEAIRYILECMPVDMPGIVIVQHMPQAFTTSFSQRLNETCKLEVKEAADGDRILNGRALIAPGNRHTMIRRSGAHYVVEVGDGEPVHRHRPSVDVLFHSAATAAGPNAIGAILTGMGQDGAEGLLEMKARGAQTLAQNEATSVVFGMAKEAIARGAVQTKDILPLDQVPSALIRAASKQNR